jgi:hypothetical protein
MNHKVDQAFQRNVGVTNDGRKELAVLCLHGKDFMHPFTWDLEIRSQGKVLYKHASNDAWLDPSFHEDDYVNNCRGYVDCKKKYYYSILGNITEQTDFFSRNRPLFDSSRPLSVHATIKKYLKERYKVSGAKADKIVKRVVDQLLSGPVVVVNVPVSPVQNEAPLLYVKEVNGFIPIDEL